jgi:hypothetical protein
MKAFNLAAMVAGAVLAVAGAGHAAIFVYSGFDTGASSVGTDSAAAAAAFQAAAGPTSLVTWEGLPSGQSTDGLTAAPGVTLTSTAFDLRTSTPDCVVRLCGANTSPGGQTFAYSNDATALLVFHFQTPISAFGVYLGGVQTMGSTINFADEDGVHSILLPSDPTGGFGFVGFTNPGFNITTVAISVPFDLISVDDVSFASAGAVPEPSTWAMMIIGFGLAGFGFRRRRIAQV